MTAKEWNGKKLEEMDVLHLKRVVKHLEKRIAESESKLEEINTELDLRFDYSAVFKDNIASDYMFNYALDKEG